MFNKTSPSSSPISLYSHMAWRISLDLFSRGSMFLLTVLIGRFLGVGDFGHYVYLTSVALVFYAFTDCGLQLQMVKELGKEEEFSANWLPYLNIKIYLAVGCVFLLFGYLKLFYRWDHPGLAILALAWMLGNSFLDFGQFVCNGLRRFDWARTQMLVQRAVIFIPTLLVLFHQPSVTTILLSVGLGSLVGTAISFIPMLRSTQFKISFKPNFAEMKRVLPLAIPNALAGALYMWWMRLGIIFLRYFVDDSTLGHYSAAFKIFETSYIIPAAIMSVSLPHLAKAKEQGPAVFRKEFGRIGWIIGTGSLAWVCFLEIFTKPIILLLFGEKFMEAIPLLRILAIVSFFSFLNYFVTQVMIALDCQLRQLYHVMVLFLISVCVHLYLIPLYSSKGAILSFLITDVLLFLTTVIFLIRHRREHVLSFNRLKEMLYSYNTPD